MKEDLLLGDHIFNNYSYKFECGVDIAYHVQKLSINTEVASTCL